MSNSNILVCDVDRSIIADYYRRAQGKSATWRYFNRNVIVARYEMLKAQRDFGRVINSRLERVFIQMII